jgi:hypothetical protein
MFITAAAAAVSSAAARYATPLLPLATRRVAVSSAASRYATPLATRRLGCRSRAARLQLLQPVTVTKISHRHTAANCSIKGQRRTHRGNGKVIECHERPLSHHTKAGAYAGPSRLHAGPLAVSRRRGLLSSSRRRPLARVLPHRVASRKPAGGARARSP